mgnify:CR=1 FL=1
MSSSAEAPIAAMRRLVQTLGLKVPPSLLHSFLRANPHYPSLLSLSQLLDYLAVDNLAVQLSASDLSTLPLPAIAHLTQQGQGAYVVLEACTADQVHYFDPQQGVRTASLRDFTQMWSGATLLVEKTPVAEKRHYPKQAAFTQADKRLLVGTAVLLTIMMAGALIHAWQQAMIEGLRLSGLLLLQVMGGLLSFNLWHYHQHERLLFGQQFCASEARRLGCAKVLRSPLAKLPGGFSLAEVGLAYFATLTLFLAGSLWLFSDLTASLTLLLLFSGLVLPFSLGLIGYQALRLKDFCLLCMAVQAVLWASAGLLWGGAAWPQPGSLGPPLGLWLICIIFVLGLGLLAKGFEISQRQRRSQTQQNYAMRLDPGVFQAHLATCASLPAVTLPVELEFGALQSDMILTLITHPFCIHCRPWHRCLEEVRERWDEEVLLRIRFYDRPKDRSALHKVYRALISLYQADPEQAWEGLSRLYRHGLGEFETWLQDYPIPPVDAATCAAIVAQNLAWSQTLHIPGTPTLLLNGRVLPPFYRPHDVSYLLKQTLNGEKAEVVK